MYEFARGPLVWIAFLIFGLGSIYKILWIVLYSRKDKVVHTYWSFKFGLRSVFRWLIPYSTRNMRLRPAFTFLTYVFHFCLLVTPIFAVGHVLLWRESWGISWWYLPDAWTTAMTIIVVVSVLILAVRRIADPTVRYVTSWTDYALLIIVGAPFVTGLMAYYQLFDYKTVVIIHMWTGAIWLAVIPFTRIVHMLFFPFSRGYMGSESGYVRNAKDY